MRGLTISAHGDLRQVEARDDLAVPVASDGEVRVRIRAAALNHLDLFVVAGLPGVTITPPWILGSDGAGIVESVGAGAADVRVGDTVVINPGTSDRTCTYCRDGDQPLCLAYGILGEHRPGTLAEYVVVPAVNVRAIPATIPIESAAGFGLATLTAWRMVVTRARVQEGDEVLIQGIGGGVAIAALQIAKLRGARVWVTSGSDAKLERALALGADVALNYRTADVAREVRARTAKRGVDAVIDSVGQATWRASLGALGKRGRLVTCGATSGPMVETDLRRMFWNQWSLMGSTMGSEDEFEAITTELRGGRLLPVVDSVFTLEDGRAAFARLESGEQFGKVVVRIP